MANAEQSYGMIVLLSGPSGVGKSTICRELFRNYKTIGFSVSCTTRNRRPNEIEGKDYYFISEDEYDKKLTEKAFLEHAEVHGFRYGTLKSELDKIREGKDILLDIDVQGVKQVKENLKNDGYFGRRLVSVFIMPPSVKELEARLRGRGTEGESVIQRRLDNAKGEMANWKNYDYVIINYDAETAAEELLHIIRGAHLRSSILTKESWND